jgi:hypothetical protein
MPSHVPRRLRLANLFLAIPQSPSRVQLPALLHRQFHESYQSGKWPKIGIEQKYTIC